MKSPARITDCIACGSQDVTLQAMSFHAEETQFPICATCAPYLDRIFDDPKFAADFIQYIGVTEVQHSHQQGGAFSLHHTGRMRSA